MPFFRSLLAVAALAWTVPSSQAATATFKNQCPYAVNVYDNDSTCWLAAGTMASPTYGCDRSIGSSTMYRKGTDSQATLAEFSLSGGKVWYDLSIVPPGSTDCSSYSGCKSTTGTSGFNVGLMIYPTSNRDASGSRCTQVMCQYEGCPGAYNYPSDSGKVYNCPESTDFHVIFCP